jgi:lysyl-tRNA synthetase class I
MQGYPINEYSTNNYYSYSNDSICNDSICSVNTLMENLGNIEGISWIQIISIKEKIINQLTENIKPQSTEITETTEKIDKLSEYIIEFMKDFKNQQEKMEQAESNMKQIIKDTQNDIKLLNSFIVFLKGVSSKYGNKTGKIEKDILEICDDIDKQTKLEEIKQIYIQEKTIFFQYLNIIKLINQMNTGSTCSICLQDNVDMYFNPCGHTACSTCCEKTMISTNQCPLCRKKIDKTQKLYFN